MAQALELQQPTIAQPLEKIKACAYYYSMSRLIDVNKIKQVLSEVLAKYPVDFVYLYGSQAKGQTHTESDVDLAFGLGKNVKDADEEVIFEVLPRIADKLHIPYEMLDIQDYDRLPLPVRFRVVRDGKLIYCVNIPEHRKKTLKTIARYHDEEPFFTQATQAFFEREAHGRNR